MRASAHGTGRASACHACGCREPRAEVDEAARVTGLLRRMLPRLDLERALVPLAEIEWGGVQPDEGIPAIHDPEFIDPSEAAEWLRDVEPVILLEVNGEARIYPLQILIWHEVVNDELGGTPVLVTFCPLCYTALAFDRRVEGEPRGFGVSGFLRESDLLLYDYRTHSLWQQLTGEAIIGAETGQTLRFLPAQIVSFADARIAYPQAPVLSRRTGFDREYGRNPYGGYDDINSSPLFTTSSEDGRLPAKARVLAIEVGNDAVAIPFDVLAEQVVVTTLVGDQAVVAFWQPGTTSAVGSTTLADSQDVGSAGAFSPILDGAPLEFVARDGAIFDVASGSRWSVTGVAVDGPLAGTRLQPVMSGSHFWFAWSVFKPHVRVVSESAR